MQFHVFLKEEQEWRYWWRYVMEWYCANWLIVLMLWVILNLLRLCEVKWNGSRYVQGKVRWGEEDFGSWVNERGRSHGYVYVQFVFNVLFYPSLIYAHDLKNFHLEHKPARDLSSIDASILAWSKGGMKYVHLSPPGRTDISGSKTEAKSSRSEVCKWGLCRQNVSLEFLTASMCVMAWWL